MKENRFESIADKKVWRAGTVYLKKRDRALAKVIDRVGHVNIELETDYYGGLVESFVYQQLAGSAANAILKKFKQLYNGRIPKPREYLNTSEKKVRSTGISPQKYSYIKDLAERMEKGTLQFDNLFKMPDEEVIKVLDEVRGIGRWTAEMFLMFSLGRTDVLPLDDLGFQKGVQRVYKLKKMPDKKKIEKLAEKWRPYRSIGTIYMWRSHEIKDWYS